MGIPSSYAIRQAVDAGNNFNEQLMGAVPGLQENAYGRYLTDFQNRVGALGQLSQDRETDYNQWLQNYQLEQKIQQQNFDNALSLYKATGKLTPEIAAALGIPYVAPSSGGGSSGGGTKNFIYEAADRARRNGVADAVAWVNTAVGPTERDRVLARANAQGVGKTNHYQNVLNSGYYKK